MFTDSLFPSALIERIEHTPIDRVIKDEFESGGTAARSLWPSAWFRRRYTITTTPLTFDEYRHIRALYARKGTSGTFYIRDNINRLGNVRVRFAAPLPQPRDAALYQLRIELEEVSPTRARPELEDIFNATNQWPIFWHDCNRLKIQYHQHDFTAEETIFDLTETHPLEWQTAPLPRQIANSNTTPHQAFRFNNAVWAKSPGNITQISAGQPACTLFAILFSSWQPTKQIFAATGQMGDGNALGIAIATDNMIEPWLGGSETWATARYFNDPDETWRSVAIVCPADSNAVRLYINGVLIGTDTRTRNWQQGPMSLGAAPDGTGKAQLFSYCQNTILLPAALGAQQLRNLHNLFAYQFDLPTA